MTVEAQLMFFALCGRVIIDGGSEGIGQPGSVTLIDVIEGLLAAPPTPDQKPESCYTNRPLFAVSFWFGSPFDGVPELLQRVRILDPAGEMRGGGTEISIGTPTGGHKVIQKIPAFPVGLEGTYKVVLEWRKPKARKWNIGATYYVSVVHKPSDEIETYS